MCHPSATKTANHWLRILHINRLMLGSGIFAHISGVRTWIFLLEHPDMPLTYKRATHCQEDFVTVFLCINAPGTVTSSALTS